MTIYGRVHIYNLKLNETSYVRTWMGLYCFTEGSEWATLLSRSFTFFGYRKHRFDNF